MGGVFYVVNVLQPQLVLIGEHEALLASVNGPWERYLASGVVPEIPTMPERRPIGEISTLYRVDSPYIDPDFSL